MLVQIALSRDGMDDLTRFRPFLVISVDSVDYKEKSIQIPWCRVRRKHQRLPSNGFIESAPEQGGRARLCSEMRGSDKTLALFGNRPKEHRKFDDQGTSSVELHQTLTRRFSSSVQSSTTMISLEVAES